MVWKETTSGVNHALPRGIALCNPGNLRPGSKWQGLVGEEGGYCRFDSDIAGIRAAALNLWTARYVHARRRVSEIITAYAPPAENRTDAYIAYMCDAMGYTAATEKNHPVDVENPIIAIRFLQNQFVFENGHPPLTWLSWPEWYCAKTMDQALLSAGHWPGLKMDRRLSHAFD